MSRASSQGNCLDPLDSLIDFSEYEQVSYQSPSISPTNSKQPQYTRPVATTPSANTLLPPPQPLSGPSHQYDLHKQQTGIPSGGLANTLAINSAQMYGYGYSSGLSPADDFIDFNTAPRQTSYSGLDIDMEFDSPSTEPAFFFPDVQSSGDFKQDFINPSSINDMPSTVLPTQSSNVGRLWPGMHQQQAAIAKAQQQQRLQQQLIQQQRQGSAAQQQRQQRPKNHQPTDPIVEEKISQLLQSMRQGSVATSEGDDASTPHGNMSHASRMRKEEEDMDEDERLLASEEGKKLSSKERRQLRNKVSARAFRSRRKEYIGQLEGEIAVKVNENSDLRAQNKALMEENTRLSDLTRMLLSSPSFSGFLDNLSSNPAAVAPQQQQAAPAPVEQRHVENRQVRKDVNPYAAQQQMQNQQINFTMIPEQAMDFSMLDLNGDGSYIYQPQVFSVLSMPEVTFDTSILSGKKSNFVAESFDSEAEKVTMPTIERMPVKVEVAVEASPIVDDEFDNDPAFALFTDAPITTSQTSIDSEFTCIFGGIQPEKAFSRLELVDSAEEANGAAAMDRVQRICESLEAVTARLEAMTVNY
jgi:hypothetical protein